MLSFVYHSIRVRNKLGCNTITAYINFKIQLYSEIRNQLNQEPIGS